ncbi:MAG: hypothetical protein IJH50_04860 [Kiritimatiellae bacterium]|nr:hypothetical protein [Kiritimatiellia bacterium]
MVREACAAFRAIHEARKNYGFALLGLRFGEAEGMDLSGYQLLPVLKRFFPRLPVIVCSFHDDMGKLARAFRNGAKWFLRKNELPDLPRILHALLTRREWEPEWRTIQECNLVAFDFEQARGTKDFISRFDAARQYLTYKCLEKYPGRTIRITPMSGGLSSAVTFKAVKVTGQQSEMLQLPLVVKIDTLANTRMEYERYFRFVRPYIPNDSGRVENPERVIDRHHSAIVYTFAGTDAGAGRLLDMKSILMSELKGECDFRNVRQHFDELFGIIMPRLHRVSPDVELGELSALTSFPNPELGETDRTKFLDNWISRISVRRKIDDVVFEKQSDSSSKKKLVGLEYFTSYDNGEQCAIEAYDDEKMTVVLTGPNVDDVVRSRSQGLRTGAMLWIDNNRFRYYGTDADGRRTCLYPVGCDEALPPLMEKPIPDYGKLPELIERIQALVAADVGGKRFRCPVGIVHGDLNFANVMIEKRISPVRSHAISDVWLIDFARTRRDLIVHDFAVMFAATVGLFDIDLSDIVVRSVFAKADRLPPTQTSDRRVVFIYAILRRVRRAALAAGVAQDMFALAVTLSLMITFRMTFRYRHFYAAANGMLKAATEIVERL